MRSDDQPTQPLTDAELVRILELMEQQPKLYSYMEKKLLSTINADRAEVDRLRAELSEVNTAIRDTGIMSTGAQGVRDVHLHFGQALQDNRAMRSELDQARKAWQAAEMAWFAGVDLFRQGDVMRAHCAAMRDALGIAHGPDWNPETKGDNYE